MPSAFRSLVIPAAPAEVWAVVRRFDGLPAWHPVIASSSLDSGAEGEVGAVRRLTTGDGGVVVERLLSLDDEYRKLVYAILESPFPVRNYVSTIRLVPVSETGETFVEWFGQFDVDADAEAEMTAVFGDALYGAGLAALRDHLGNAASA